jgi:small subunit ribosomal protein S8
MLNDPLANVLSMVNNYDNIGKKECMINPVSSLILHTLKLMQDNQYIGSAEEVTSQRGGIFKLNLLGNINKCGVIKPRWSVKTKDYEKFEKRYLPAKGMGILIISTPKGLMTHEQAKDQNMGGRLIAYCY